MSRALPIEPAGRGSELAASGGPPQRLGSGRGEAPRLGIAIERRQLLAAAAFVLLALALLYVVAPQLPGVKHTWERLNEGNAWWIGVALALELASMASYVAIFRGVHVPPGSPITYRDAYKITMASLAATRLFAAGGAGGVALTAWSLRRSGMARREVATRMIGFLVLLYGVYVVAMIVCGVGLYLGVFAGAHPFAITIGPAIVGAVGIALFASLACMPERVEQRVAGTAAKPSRGNGLLGRIAAGPALLVKGVRFAIYKVRRPDWAMLGAVSWWAFNVAVLYASFRAFGPAPPIAVVVQAYFVGMLANLLPVPGGIGVVDGGMIGASVALGVSFHQALTAVLTYRLFAFWLPSIPGAVAYFQLRRSVHRWERDEVAEQAAIGRDPGLSPAATL
jgi:putative heme transporter